LIFSKDFLGYITFEFLSVILSIATKLMKYNSFQVICPDFANICQGVVHFVASDAV